MIILQGAYTLSYAMALQLAVAKDIIAKDGAGGLYKGLSAGLLRQATYTTARLGIFQIFSDMLKKQNEGRVRHTFSLDWSTKHISSQLLSMLPLELILV